MPPRTLSSLPQCIHCLRTSLRPKVPPSRQFSITSRNDASLRSKSELPIFPPMSSKELDAVLAHCNRTLFVPSLLSQEQKKAVYKTTKHHILRDNPITVRQGDHEFQVTPVMPKDLPKTESVLREIIERMETSQDFKELPKVLMAMTHARRKISAALQAKIARKAFLMGEGKLIMELAKGSRRTGFSLGGADTAVFAMLGARDIIAARGGWTDETSWKTANKMAWDIARMLDEPEHEFNPLRSEKKFPARLAKPNAQPGIIGVLLELAAVEAIKLKGKEDPKGVIPNLVDKFLASWPNNTYEWPLMDDGPLRFDYCLTRWSPVWNGIRAALQFDTLHELQKENLQAVLNFLQGKLEQSAKILREDKPPHDRWRGLEMYEALSKLKL